MSRHVLELEVEDDDVVLLLGHRASQSRVFVGTKQLRVRGVCCYAHVHEGTSVSLELSSTVPLESVPNLSVGDRRVTVTHSPVLNALKCRPITVQGCTIEIRVDAKDQDIGSVVERVRTAIQEAVAACPDGAAHDEVVTEETPS